MTLAEDDILLPDQEIGVAGQDGLELEGQDGLELADQVPDLNLSLNDAFELSDNLLELDTAVEAGEASPEADGALADNVAETVEIRYIDARGKRQDEKTCIKVKAGDENRTLGPGWYAVTEDVHFEKDMIIQNAVNLILCDGATLKVDDGIWVQPQASLTIWAQSDGKNRGRLVARGGNKKAGIGCSKSYVAGFTVINGGDI